jgi:hypothetical protein
MKLTEGGKKVGRVLRSAARKTGRTGKRLAGLDRNSNGYSAGLLHELREQLVRLVAESLVPLAEVLPSGLPGSSSVKRTARAIESGAEQLASQSGRAVEKAVRKAARRLGAKRKKSRKLAAQAAGVAEGVARQLIVMVAEEVLLEAGKRLASATKRTAEAASDAKDYVKGDRTQLLIKTTRRRLARLVR